MHSSRMRTIRSSSSLPRGVGVCPVGSVSPAGLPLTRGVSASDQGGVSAQEGDVCLGVSAWGCLLRGCISQHALGQTSPSPMDKITDACENITLPQLRCGR